MEPKPDLRAQLQSLAAAHDQTLAELVRRVLAEVVPAAGPDPRPDSLADRPAAIKTRLSALERGWGGSAVSTP